MLKMKNRFFSKIKNILLKESNWKEIEYFDETWKNRIKEMSALIPDGVSSLIDVGCGKSWLKQFIKSDIRYFGLDYQRRDENTIVCDLNNKEFPNIEVDLAFCSGVFEYIEQSNIDWFMKNLNHCASHIVISYCSLDLNPKIKVRKSYGWKNHYKKSDFIRLVSEFGFELDTELSPIDGNNIFKFNKVEELV